MEKIERIVFIFIVLFSIILLFVTFDLKPELGDEGILAMDGWRIYKGEIPQKDFFQFIPPLAAYIQGLFFKIFSPTIFSIRLLGIIYGLLLLLFTYILFSDFIANKLVLSLALSLVVIFGVSGWYFGSHHWLCNLLQIIGVYIFKKGLDAKKIYLAYISGIFLGLAVFTLQDQGGYAVIGLLLATHLSKDEIKSHLIYASVSAILTFALSSFPFILSRGAFALFQDWVIFPLFNYRQNSGNDTGLSFIFQQFLGLWDLRLLKMSPLYTLSYAVFHTFILFLPLLCILSLYLIYKKKYLNKTNFVVVTVFSLVFLLTSLRRATISNFIWASPAFLPFYIITDKFLSERRKLLRIGFTILVWILIACALIYGFIKFSFCVNKNYVFTAQTISGSYRFFNKYECSQFQELVDEIEKRVPKEEYLFCVGYIPLVNFVTQRENPTRLNFVFTKGYNTEEQILNWLDDIERKKIRYGIGDKKKSSEYFRRVLLKKYKTVFENDKYFFLQRIER